MVVHAFPRGFLTAFWSVLDDDSTLVGRMASSLRFFPGEDAGTSNTLGVAPLPAADSGSKKYKQKLEILMAAPSTVAETKVEVNGCDS